MDERQIKKAAQELCTTETQPDWMKDFGISSFMDGARWRINSVWHDASEVPQHSGLLIAICKDGKAVLCGPNNSNWETTVKIFHIVRWAYLSDLLPERKEEAE